MNLFQLRCFISLIVYVSGVAGETLQKGRTNDYFFLEGKEISFQCFADNVVGNYSIKWSSVRDGEAFKNGTDDRIIFNTQDGSSISSKLILSNSRKLPNKRYIVHCNLMKDGQFSGKSENFGYRPLLLIDFPNATVSSSVVKLDYGKTKTLTCTVRGDLKLADYALDITWSKDNVVLKQTSQKTNGVETPLDYTITKADGSNGGVYICRGYIDVRGKTIQDNATTTVSVFPKLIGSVSKKEFGILGDDVKIRCDIDGYPLNITWDFEKIEARTSPDVSHDGKVVTVRNFQRGNAGQYICKTKNKDNNDIIQTTTLVAKVLAHLKNGSNPKQNVTIIPGNKTLLRCDISGAPLPCISWRVFEKNSDKARDVSSIPGVKPPLKCQNTLELGNNTALQDGQIFSCNKGDISQSFYIIKMTKPRLTGKPTKEIKSKEGDDVTFKCDIEVNPLDIDWFVGDQLLSGSSKKYGISTSDPRQFTVNDVDKSDRGSFYCQAKNALLTVGVRQKIVLRVKTRNDWLWPVVGTIIVIVLVALIIGITTYRQRRKRREQEAQDAKDARELQEATTTHEEDGGEPTDKLMK